MTDDHCEICEEYFRPNDERGEFVLSGGEHIVAHAQCGLNEQLEIA